MSDYGGYTAQRSFRALKRLIRQGKLPQALAEVEFLSSLMSLWLIAPNIVLLFGLTGPLLYGLLNMASMSQQVSLYTSLALMVVYLACGYALTKVEAKILRFYGSKYVLKKINAV